MGNVDSMIFKPPNIQYSVEQLKQNVEKDSEVYFTKENICIYIIYPKHRNNNKYVLWSYGNACNILTMKEYAINFVNKYQIPLILYDYIGYGLSTLSSTLPSEQNCYDSLKSVMDFLNISQESEWIKKDIILVGHSLGTGVVIDYVSKDIYWDTPIVLISPYKSMVSILFDSNLKYFLSYFDRFNSFSKINSVFCPVKIFHGMNDTLIHFSHSKSLHSFLPNPIYSPTFFANVGHNDILEYVDFSFLNFI